MPDLPILRKKKIVNVRELIRFELETLSVSKPPDHQIAAFDVMMAALPRNAAGQLDRHEIVERYRTGRLRALGRESATRPLDHHAAGIVRLVQDFVGPGVEVCPESNLELDLGLDSIRRVELLAFLEGRCGGRIPGDAGEAVFTVGDLANALPPTARGAEMRARFEQSVWNSLRETGGSDAPGLLRRRMFTAAAVYGLVRVLRAIVRPRVGGLEHVPRKGPFIITPNHQSYIDPLVIESVLPFAVFQQLFFVAASEYFETPVRSRLARALNIVPVDPDANLVSALRAGAFGLKHGKVLVLFPEGERSIDGTVRTFKNGAAILAQQLNVPVVPVAITGTFEIWPRARPLDWRRLLPWSGHRVTVQFGTPIRAPEAGCPYADYTEAIRGAVEQMWASAMRSPRDDREISGSGPAVRTV